LLRSVKRAATATGAAAVALAATAALATPAQAAGHAHYTAITTGTIGFVAGAAHFYSYGDRFTLIDRALDGWGVTLIVDRGEGIMWRPLAVLYNGRGQGKTNTYDWDLPEGQRLRFKVCIQKSLGSPATRCGTWRDATA
jgi:hypothetical protein